MIDWFIIIIISIIINHHCLCTTLPKFITSDLCAL